VVKIPRSFPRSLRRGDEIAAKPGNVADAPDCRINANLAGAFKTGNFAVMDCHNDKRVPSDTGAAYYQGRIENYSFGGRRRLRRLKERDE
jgi:hypothetical protein